MDAVGNDERSISITREIVTSPSLIVCIAVPPEVRSRKPSRGWGLGRRPLGHGCPQRPLVLEEQRFSLSDQDIGSVPRFLALLHQVPRRVPHRLRPHAYFGWQHRAAEEMPANILGEVEPASRTEVRAASTEQVAGELRETEALVTRRAMSNDVPRAVD